MNICFLTPRYYPNTPGGGALSCHLLARELGNHVNVDVISFDGADKTIREIEGVKVFRFKPVSSEKTRLNIQAYNILKKRLGNYDLIHAYNMDLTPALGLLTARRNIESIATLNGTIYTRTAEWYNVFQNDVFNIKNTVLSISLLIRNVFHRSIVKRIKMFTVLCQYRKEIFVNEGFPPDKISVITNILDNKNQISRGCREDGKLGLLYLGGGRWRKGLDVLIRAYSLLRRQNIKLVIGGPLNDKKILGMIEKMKPLNDIEGCGELTKDEVGEAYSKADILIVPSRYPEPVSRVLIEGMDSGLCVIVHSSDYYSPIIRDGKDGVLFSPCNPENLAQKIQGVLDQKGFLESMKKGARNRVRDVCDPVKIGKEYLALYETVIDGD